MRDKDWERRKKASRFLDEMREIITAKLLEDSDFTGKISIDLNCNQGGVTGVEVYTKSKIISDLKNNNGSKVF